MFDILEFDTVTSELRIKRFSKRTGQFVLQRERIRLVRDQLNKPYSRIEKIKPTLITDQDGTVLIWLYLNYLSTFITFYSLHHNELRSKECTDELSDYFELYKSQEFRVRTDIKFIWKRLLYLILCDPTTYYDVTNGGCKCILLIVRVYVCEDTNV